MISGESSLGARMLPSRTGCPEESSGGVVRIRRCRAGLPPPHRTLAPPPSGGGAWHAWERFPAEAMPCGAAPPAAPGRFAACIGGKGRASSYRGKPAEQNRHWPVSDGVESPSADRGNQKSCPIGRPVKAVGPAKEGRVRPASGQKKASGSAGGFCIHNHCTPSGRSSSEGTPPAPRQKKLRRSSSEETPPLYFLVVTKSTKLRFRLAAKTAPAPLLLLSPPRRRGGGPERPKIPLKLRSFFLSPRNPLRWARAGAPTLYCVVFPCNPSGQLRKSFRSGGKTLVYPASPGYEYGFLDLFTGECPMNRCGAAYPVPFRCQEKFL